MAGKQTRIAPTGNIFLFISLQNAKNKLTKKLAEKMANKTRGKAKLEVQKNKIKQERVENK